jgi:DnaK suppressor protein
MHEEIRDELNAMKARLEGRLDKMNLQKLEGSRPALNADSEEQAQELANEEVIEGLDENHMETLAQIETALSAIKRGTYGTCVDCEEPIAPARLKAIPFASRCIACANAQA